MLVVLVVVCGAELRGCCRQHGPVENVHITVVMIFMGMGRLHPVASLQFNEQVTSEMRGNEERH